MYYGILRLKEAFGKILQKSSSHSACQLVIFVSCLNIDALCATKLLTLLFKKQLVQSQIVPVFGYSELKRNYMQLDESINTVILVGCGGMIDIESFLEVDQQALAQESELTRRDIYVFDSHRPWNLDNIFGSEMVKCFDDGTIEETLEEQKKAYLELVKLEAERDDASSGEEDGDEPTDEDEDNDESDDDTESTTSTKKRFSNDDKDDKRKRKKHRKRLIHSCEEVLEDYYSQGTSVVNSISTQVYSLASSIGETNLHYLWLTILGATSVDAINPQIYNRLFPILQDEVKRLSPRMASLKTPDTINLNVQPDYFLFLLRHSSLYDSFFYSNYVNAKLSLWNEHGKKQLHKMFARMGIPLHTAQEAWLYMDHSIKRDLTLIFEKNLDRYGLQDIVRDGFVRTTGYKTSISATEFVEALTSLLEVGRSMDDADGINDYRNNDDKNIAEHISDILSKRQKKWVSNFWLGWDALDDRNSDLLDQGIKHAKMLQKSVFNTGMTILEKRLLKNLRIYRLCVLQDGPDLELYRNPLTLLRLGNWLIECCAESEDKQLLPLVLASLDESTDTYLVAGLAPRYPRGLSSLHTQTPILNNFSMAFQQITIRTGAKVKIDNFESSIIEIQREDLSPFLEKLTLSGLL